MSKEPLVKGCARGITDGSQLGFAVGDRRCVSRVRPTRPQVVGGGAAELAVCVRMPWVRRRVRREAVPVPVPSS